MNIGYAILFPSRRCRILSAVGLEIVAAVVLLSPVLAFPDVLLRRPDQAFPCATGPGEFCNDVPEIGGGLKRPASATSNDDARQDEDSAT